MLGLQWNKPYMSTPLLQNHARHTFLVHTRACNSQDFQIPRCSPQRDSLVAGNNETGPWYSTFEHLFETVDQDTGGNCIVFVQAGHMLRAEMTSEDCIHMQRNRLLLIDNRLDRMFVQICFETWTQDNSSNWKLRFDLEKNQARKVGNCYCQNRCCNARPDIQHMC